MTDGQYAESRALLVRLAWLRPWLDRALAWGMQPHWWAPAVLRRAPVVACAWVVRLELWRLRRGL